MTHETWQKVATSVISGAILLALTASGQIAFTYFTVQKNSEQIKNMKETQEDYLKNDAFLRYVELAEERNKYLIDGIDRNAERLKLIEIKIDRELSKIREALGYKYKGGT
jgi:hypothetical protein